MPEGSTPSNPKTAYEHKDAPISLLVGILGLVAVVTIAAALILSGIYPAALREASPAPARLPPKPRLEIDEARALRRFEARVAKRLDSYGWVDRKRGIVHIPISLALREAAQRGFPDWPGNPGTEPASLGKPAATTPKAAGNVGNAGAAATEKKAAGQ